MKKIKKSLAVVLSLIMAIAVLSACTGGTAGSDPKHTTEDTEPTEVVTTTEAEPTEPALTVEPTEPTETAVSGEEESAEPVVADNEYFRNDEGYIVFGHYEQDADESNGPEPIEWEVLEDNGDSMLLVSRYILDVQPYDTEGDVTWESCSLRRWLNNDFFNTAFTDEEQSKVQMTILSNPDNVNSGAKGGNDTEDKMFILSAEEIINLYSFNSWYDGDESGYCQMLIVNPTAQSMNNGILNFAITQQEYNDKLLMVGYDENCIGLLGAQWWLRSPGFDNDFACIVESDGWTGWGPTVNVDALCFGVRPAFYLAK